MESLFNISYFGQIKRNVYKRHYTVKEQKFVPLQVKDESGR